MSEMNNPLLEQAEQKVESQLEEENRANYLKIVVAGMHAALDGGPNSILASIKQSKDPISDCAKGAVSLVLILRKQAHGIMPLKAMVPAAMTLMLKALDFADRSGVVKVGRPELIKATKIFTDTIFARFGISKDQIAKAGEKVDAITRDPSAMSKINLKAGVTRDPSLPLPPGAPAA